MLAKILIAGDQNVSDSINQDDMCHITNFNVSLLALCNLNTRWHCYQFAELVLKHTNKPSMKSSY